MDDIVARLREYAKDWRERAASNSICLEAADEIERLRRATHCENCDGTGWVCENHPNLPWDSKNAASCDCGAGMPCGVCNKLAFTGTEEGSAL
jgi:hypothetical protein